VSWKKLGSELAAFVLSEKSTRIQVKLTHLVSCRHQTSKVELE
jgi:hypothetical protein